jgi:hypothetical protein
MAKIVIRGKSVVNQEPPKRRKSEAKKREHEDKLNQFAFRVEEAKPPMKRPNFASFLPKANASEVTTGLGRSQKQIISALFGLILVCFLCKFYLAQQQVVRSKNSQSQNEFSQQVAESSGIPLSQLVADDSRSQLAALQKYDDNLDPDKPPDIATESYWRNPSMGWFERIFCRGFQISSFCSYETLHPFVEVSAQSEIPIEQFFDESDSGNIDSDNSTVAETREYTNRKMEEQ